MRLLTVAAILGLVGCAKPAPTQSNGPVPNLGGSWTGALFATSRGAGALTLSLTQEAYFLTPSGGSELHLHGTWLTSFANSADDDSGTVAGFGWSQTNGIMLTLTDSRGCAFALAGTRTGAVSMIGAFATKGCSAVDSGSFGVTKE